MKDHVIKHWREPSSRQLYRIVRVGTGLRVESEVRTQHRPIWARANDLETLTVLGQAYLDLHDYCSRFAGDFEDLKDDNLKEGT